MTTDVITQVVTAGATVTFGRGRFFALLAATSPVTVTFEDRRVGGSQTQRRVLNNVGAGTKMYVNPGEEWTYVRVFSAAANTITVGVSDDNIEFTSAVSIVNVPTVIVQASSIVSTIAPAAIAATTLAVIAQNLARKRITVAAASANSLPIYIQQAAGNGATTAGIPVPAGTSYTLNTTSSIGLWNPAGVSANYSTFEET